MSNGIILRERLLESVEAFRSPMLLTLTVDRSGTTTGQGFPNPEAALEYVTENHFLPRLMRLIGVVQWVWCLEFQAKQGDGWPHWHLLIDVGHFGRSLPKPKLQKMWRLWRDKWGIGGLDLEKIRGGEGSAEHRRGAIIYLTKYLCKAPPDGWPEWVLRRSRVRLVGTSKAVGAIVAPAEDRPRRETGSAVRGRKNQRAIVDRVAGCKSTCRVLWEGVNPETGESVRRFVSNLPGYVNELQAMSKEGKLPVLLEWVEVAGFGFTAHRVEVTAGSLQCESVLQALEEAGYLAELERRVSRKREALLQEFHKRKG